ncbi:MAG: BatA domain-containing protein [Candidatus Latescibacterota bacterium]|nr:MAG: BatA domain-containing protein [Candidatus Latescibacterota bacterium]
MFGLGFLNSLFLFALGAMVLPIAIHILNRRRLRKIRFSSLEFIYELNKRRMSKINLRRWIILALRTLAVVLIVFAFARPTIQRGAGFFVPGEAPKHVVICLDVSYSMGAEQEEGTAFSIAQGLAGEVIDECRRNDLVNVVAFSERSNVLFEAGTRNKQIVASAIDELRVTAEGTSIDRAIQTASELVRSSDVATSEIYMISDFRETGDSLAVVDLPENTRLILVPVYREPIDNASIDRVFTPRKLIRPGETVRIGVSTTNHSHEQPANFPLELVIGGKRKAEKIINLSPASSATETFVVSLPDKGTYRCRVAKNRDRLPIDDDRFFVMEVSEKIPVTLVRGKNLTGNAQTERTTAAYFFVDKALNPRSTSEGEFSVDVIDQKDITVASLPNKGVVVWTEPQTLDRRRLDLLKRYVHRGGAVLIFLGGDRRGFWRDVEFARYLGIQRAAPKEKPEGERLTSFSQGHPVFNLFNEEELELLSRSRVTKYLSVTGVAPDSTLAYLQNGDPAIWECARGAGRIIVVAAAPDLVSGNVPLSPMFLPLIHTAVSYLAASNRTGSRQENTVGTDLFFDLPPKWNAQTGELRVLTEAGGEAKPILYESKQGETKALLPRPQAIGFYTLLADTSRIAEACVNVDTRESNLNPRPLEETDLGQARVVETSGDFAQNLRRETQGREIYAVFLLLALSALVVEALLGRKA